MKEGTAAQTQAPTQNVKFGLSKAPAFNEGQLIGYRYQVVMPERHEEGVTIYESYLRENPLDEAHHDKQATLQYNQYINELLEKVKLGGYTANVVAGREDNGNGRGGV